ncbi:MAG: hypothetical protein IPQ16_05195 [Geobacteraceae bacterium]|nr:hypothetical protein [Geobacteraceae bacterium]
MKLILFGATVFLDAEYPSGGVEYSTEVAMKVAMISYGETNEIKQLKGPFPIWRCWRAAPALVAGRQLKKS